MAIIRQRLKDVISAVSEKTKIDVFHVISIWKCVDYLPYKATHNSLCVTVFLSVKSIHMLNLPRKYSLHAVWSFQ